MTANIKYTTDGKKVAVIGKLNDAETIVQEVFVTESGAEVPSGANFLIKSLHDEPVTSWHDRHIATTEATHKRLTAELETYRRKVLSANDKAQAHARALTAFASSAAAEQLATLEAFVSGEITHVVTGSEYGAPRIREFSDAIADPRDYDRDAVKLLSLFGRTNGTLEWRLHRYSDHSGGSSRVIPARGYDDAVRIVQELYNARVKEWLDDGKKHSTPSGDWKKNVPEVVESRGVVEANKKADAKARKEKIAKLETQLAELKEGNDGETG